MWDKWKELYNMNETHLSQIHVNTYQDPKSAENTKIHSNFNCFCYLKFSKYIESELCVFQ